MKHQQYAILVALPIIVYLSCTLLSATLVQNVAPTYYQAVMYAASGHVSFEKIWSGVLIGPLLEELIFRKLIFNFLQKKTNTKAAFVLSVLLFTAAHIPSRPVIYLGESVIIGMVCQYVYYKSGSIWSAIYLHSTFNILTLYTSISLMDSMKLIGFQEDLSDLVVQLGFFLSILILAIILKKYKDTFSHAKSVESMN